jgi:hypothetical protein
LLCEGHPQKSNADFRKHNPNLPHILSAYQLKQRTTAERFSLGMTSDGVRFGISQVGILESEVDAVGSEFPCCLSICSWRRSQLPGTND